MVDTHFRTIFADGVSHANPLQSMSYSRLIREEELKNKVAKDFFSRYDNTQMLGNVDFAVAVPTTGPQLFETEYLLWAEAKKGDKSDIEKSFVQLIITIGRARTFEKHLPPRFLGAFNARNIAFIPYNDLLEIFYQNDFNWNVAPSDHTTKEFIQVHERVKEILRQNTLVFDYDTDAKELQRFIKNNFIVGKPTLSKIRISKNNFVAIYQKWLTEVKPTIQVNWDTAKKNGIIDADFYLADILSEHNVSLREKLFVLLRETYYELDRQHDDMGLFTSSRATFNDDQHAHTLFWNRYNRPPKRDYWDYIVERRDLLVPPDVRERKGSYFTPQKWVELSQQYLADELGENWQDEYYIWDCAAGTGNLLNGLTNKYRIWASTIDKADVDVMHERIKNGANLLDEHVFQFDFLNDPFDKLPPKLKEIIDDEDKRKKLVIYINPPYAEGDNRSGEGRKGVALSITQDNYGQFMGYAKREMFIQFMTRVHQEIPSSVLANFSTLKNLQAPKFRDFRTNFRAKLGRNFLVPAKTFDNVSGEFPIGFFIYHLNEKQVFTQTTSDVYDANGIFISQKEILSYDSHKVINDWVQDFIDKAVEATKDSKQSIGTLIGVGNDFQNQRTVRIEKPWRPWNHQFQWQITIKNLVQSCIYLTVRTIINATWLNDRDQYLYPDEGWVEDTCFQNDCLAFALFNNNIQSRFGINHWIPFTEEEVGARDCFKSHFMTDYISGKARPSQEATLFSDGGANDKPLEFSAEATAVMDAGRELWRYYHSQPDSNPDASLYDIKLHFQGTKKTKSGKTQMKSDSEDEIFTKLIGELKHRLKSLAVKIEPKVYEYKFLNR